MKNNFWRLAAAVMVTVAAATGCDRGGLKVKSADLQLSEDLVEGRADSISVSAFVEYPVAGLTEDAMRNIVAAVNRAAFQVDEAEDIEMAERVWADSCIRDYREANMDLLQYLQDNGEEAAVLSWEMSVSGYFCGVYEDMYSYNVVSYSYTGGAHGSTVETGLVFNGATGEPVVEDDLFADGYRETLSELLSSHLEESLIDTEAYDALFIKDIEPNGNFIVTADGITYTYGQYEVGPYYLGIIKVTVPWDELQSILR